MDCSKKEKKRAGETKHDPAVPIEKDGEEEKREKQRVNLFDQAQEVLQTKIKKGCKYCNILFMSPPPKKKGKKQKRKSVNISKERKKKKKKTLKGTIDLQRVKIEIGG